MWRFSTMQHSVFVKRNKILFKKKRYWFLIKQKCELKRICTEKCSIVPWLGYGLCHKGSCAEAWSSRWYYSKVLSPWRGGIQWQVPVILKGLMLAPKEYVGSAVVQSGCWKTELSPIIPLSPCSLSDTHPWQVMRSTTGTTSKSKTGTMLLDSNMVSQIDLFPLQALIPGVLLQ